MSRNIPDGATQGGSPTLRPDNLDGADAAIGTVTAAEFNTSKFGGEKLCLTFAEWPDRQLWVNKTGTRSIVAKLGRDMDKYIGKSIPLVCVRQTVGSNTHHVVQVAPQDEWDAMLKRGGKRKAR